MLKRIVFCAAVALGTRFASATTVYLSVNDVVVTEGTSLSRDTQVFFNLRLSEPLSTTFNLPITLHDGTAKAGSDYVKPSWTSITFPAHVTSIDLPFYVIADSAPEGDETFTIELGTPSNPSIVVTKSVGTCTILDDDNAVTPLAQKVPRGTTGVIHVTYSDPATAPEVIQLLSSDAFLTFPSSVTIPAGSSFADIEVGGTGVGTGTISVITPASRGGRVYGCSVTIYDPVTLTVDPLGVTIPLGQNTSVTAKIDPPPSSPITVALTQTKPSIADIPQTIVVDAKGTTSIPVHSLSAGTTVVTATLPDTNGGNTQLFTVNVSVPAGLAITSLSLRSGRAAGGDNVTIFGNNFGSRCVVTFGGVPSPSSSTPGNGAVSVTTPPHDAGVVDVGIRCGSDSFVYPSAFTYVASPLALGDLTPATGTARGGTIVFVHGTNLRTGLCSATIGGIPAHAIAWSGTTTMTIVTPPHAAGVVPVTLTCGSESSTLPAGFTYATAEDTPSTIFRLTPTIAAPGSAVFVSGARFRPDDVISFDATVAPDDVPMLATDQHLVVVPELPAGNSALMLRDAAGRAISGGNFTILTATTPAITQAGPHLTAASEFAVTGSGFRRALTFLLGNTALQPLTISSTRALFRVPADAAPGATTFAIADRGTTVASRAVDVTPSGIAVTAISPQCATREGKLLATLNGSGFAEGAMVQFAGTWSPNVIVRDAFTLVAEVPPAFFATNATITVTNPDGTSATLTNAFVYKSAAEGGCTTPKHRAAGR